MIYKLIQTAWEFDLAICEVGRTSIKQNVARMAQKRKSINVKENLENNSLATFLSHCMMRINIKY